MCSIIDINFEKEMSNAKVVSGASMEEIERLSKLAKKMGIETKYSSTEVAKSMIKLLKAGLTPAQVEAGALQVAALCIIYGRRYLYPDKKEE